MTTQTTKALLFAGASATVLAACSGAEEPAETTTAAAPAADVSYADGVYVGPRVENLRGGYQAQVTIEGGTITAVDPVEAGTNEPESLRVNAFAVPDLVERVLAAQSADVEHVSGSSFTSPAFLESIAGALEEAAQ